MLVSSLSANHTGGVDGYVSYFIEMNKTAESVSLMAYSLFDISSGIAFLKQNTNKNKNKYLSI